MTSFGSRKKVCNLQIRYHFLYNSCGPVNGVRKLKKGKMIVSMWHLVEISEEIAVYAYGNPSNSKLEEPRAF